MPRSSCRGSSISVLCREGPRGGHPFDVSQQQETGRQRNYSLDIAQPLRVGPARSGKPAGIFPVTGTPSNGSRSTVAAMIANVTTPSATGFPGNKPFAQHNQADRDNTDDKNNRLRLAELSEQRPGPVKEVMPATCNPKQNRSNWRHHNSQAGASLEADKNAVADQLHQGAQPQQPREKTKRRDREGGEACDIGVMLRIALRHCA